MSNRTLRVNELVQRELSDILRQRYQSDAVMITIVEVRISPDLHDGKAFISVVGDESVAKAKLQWLRAKAPEIREELGKRIVLKFLPKIEYNLDLTVARSSRIQQMLDEMGPLAAENPPPSDPPGTSAS